MEYMDVDAVILKLQTLLSNYFVIIYRQTTYKKLSQYLILYIVQILSHYL